MDNILATGISQKEHLAALDKVAAARFSMLEIEKVLVYMIDTVDADALYFLAEQFDALGHRGWKLATNDAERRAVVKRALRLGRYAGTPYGIKEALRTVGFDNTIIHEHVGNLYDGSIDFDGVHTYSATEWATFRVIFDLGNDKGMSAEQTADLVAMVNEYKNARSLFMGYSWKATLTDSLAVSDEFEVTMILDEFTDQVSDGLDFNGLGTYNGGSVYTRWPDPMTVVIIP